ncbi:hypothetical protein DFS33DRAFT_1277412 [Desarmillaria ectypa]|nr:hypothetical protein DFS33DRAFT_1277412 [Desarmillaria ectypa]
MDKDYRGYSLRNECREPKTPGLEALDTLMARNGTDENPKLIVMVITTARKIAPRMQYKVHQKYSNSASARRFISCFRSTEAKSSVHTATVQTSAGRIQRRRGRDKGLIREQPEKEPIVEFPSQKSLREYYGRFMRTSTMLQLQCNATDSGYFSVFLTPNVLLMDEHHGPIFVPTTSRGSIYQYLSLWKKNEGAVSPYREYCNMEEHRSPWFRYNTNALSYLDTENVDRAIVIAHDRHGLGLPETYLAVGAEPSQAE